MLPFKEKKRLHAFYMHEPPEARYNCDGYTTHILPKVEPSPEAYLVGRKKKLIGSNKLFYFCAFL